MNITGFDRLARPNEDTAATRGHPLQSSRTGALSSSSMTRWKINEAAREALEDQYMRKRFPSPLSKKRLAEQLDVAPRRIQVWFQNRRQRARLCASSKPFDNEICKS